jgi:hypothetical protein
MQSHQKQPQPLSRETPASADATRWKSMRSPWTRRKREVTPSNPLKHVGARVGWIAGLLLTLAACQSSERYVWGDYEDSVFRVTSAAGEVDVQNELAEMLELVQRAADKDKPVPPGLHAHIGLLYSLAGDSGNAEAAFRTEMALYPESAAFLGGVLERAKGQAGVPQP